MTRWQLFWRTTWLHLRRAPRDLRSLRYVGSLLYFVLYGLYVSVAVHYYGVWWALCVATFTALGFGIALLIARSHRRADAAMLNLAPARDSIHLAAPGPGHFQAVQQLLLRRVIFTYRAAAEVMVRNDLLAPEAHGQGRRRSIDLARASGLWVAFSEEEREELASQEGSWPEQRAHECAMWAEDVSVLRWVLCIDKTLTPLEFATLSFLPVLEVATGQKKFCEKLLAPPDVRSAREQTYRVYERAVAECVSRGLSHIDDALIREALLRLADISRGSSSDLLAGVHTFEETDDERVSSLTRIASRRLITLCDVLEIFDRPSVSCEPE